MAELAIDTMGKGGVPDLHDSRDYKLDFVVSAPRVDWTIGKRLTEPPDRDQYVSDSCGPHAASYYHWQLTGKLFSVRDLSCRTLLPSYGSYTRDNAIEIVDRGQADVKEVKDPEKPTPQNMRDATGTNQALRNDDKELKAFSMKPYDIDAVAFCVQNYKGCMLGVQGDNAGWADMLNPKPPTNADWGHLIYAFGYHMHNGQKCIICKSSWCTTGIKEHHIKEDYFQSDTFSPWVVIPRSQYMIERYKVQKGGKLGVCVSVDGEGIFNDTVYWAKSEEHFNQMLAQYEIPTEAKTIVYPV